MRNGDDITSSMDTFSTLLAICVGNSPVTGKFPSQRPVAWSFDVYFDLRLNKRLSKQLKHWWLEMPLCSLWCHCNGSPSSGNWVNIGSGNDLLPVRHQATIWTNSESLNQLVILKTWNENRNKIKHFHSIKCICKCHLQNVAHFVLILMCWHIEAGTKCPFFQTIFSNAFSRIKMY